MFKTLFHSAPSVHHQKNKVQSHHDDTQLLKLEAEKIRNWHIQTEINSKNMEKVVQNLRMTVESQRKSLLEVQLEYESVGNKMQEEINKRMHCLQKIDSTRDMCSLLKTQTCDLEKTLDFCDSIKSDIGCQQKEHDLVVAKLADDFKNLSASHERAKVDFSKTLVDYKNANEAEKNVLEKDVAEYKNQVSKCTEDLLNGELVIDVLIYCLSKVQKELVENHRSNEHLININKDMMNELNQITLNCNHLQAVLDDKQICIKDNKNKLQLVRKKLKEAELLCDHLQLKLNDCSAEMSSKNCKIKTLESSLISQANEVKEIKKNKEKSDESLKECSKKLEENTALKKDLELQVLQLIELKNQLFTENAKYKADEEFLKNLKFQNKAMINQLLEELSQTKIEKENVANSLSQSRATIEELQLKITDIDQMNAILNNKLKSALSDLENSFCKVADNQKTQEILDDELKNQIDENSKLKEEIASLKKLESVVELYEELKNQYDDQARSLEETKQSLVSATQNFNTEKERCCEFEQTIEKNKLTINEQEMSMKATIALYNGLLKIRDELTRDVNDLDKQVKASNVVLLAEKRKHDEAIEKLKKDHGKEIESLNVTLRSAKDKYAILKEEVDLKKVESFSTINRKERSHRRPEHQLKRPHFSPFHNVSGSEHDISVSAVLSCGGSVKKQPKHSTPIRTPKQKKCFFSAKKSKSTKKAVWRRTTPRVKQAVSESAPKAKEVNWFDTDNVYGFFD